MTVATPRLRGDLVSHRHADLRRRAVDLRDRAPMAAMRFLDAAAYGGPRIALSLARVAEAYDALASGLGDVEPYYAVKANPNPAILRRLAGRGAGFDVASRGELDRCLALGAAPERISYGNTIKRESDIADAYAKGVRLFAFDSLEELEKIARAAPGSGVFARLRVEDESADYPLGKKFGCAPAMLEGLLLRAAEFGLGPLGLSFHVGSQMRDAESWRPTILEAARVQRRLGMRGLHLSLLNIGGGFPAGYGGAPVDLAVYAAEVRALLTEIFGAALPPRLMAEPGRALVAEAGVLEAEVLLVSRKSETEDKRWVYLDIGRYGGLAETEGEAIRYPILTARDGEATGPCAIAGPTCDSADVVYDRTPVALPLGLRAGDRVRLLGAGAYVTTYAAQWFNGFEPLQEIVVDA